MSPTHHEVLLAAAACFNDVPPELLQSEGAAAVESDVGSIALGQTSSLQRRQEHDVRQETDTLEKTIAKVLSAQAAGTNK